MMAQQLQPFSLADCEVIGFDLDHTLCRYNLLESARVSECVVKRPAKRAQPSLLPASVAGKARPGH